jgi:hypothetical protein
MIIVARAMDLAARKVFNKGDAQIFSIPSICKGDF